MGSPAAAEAFLAYSTNLKDHLGDPEIFDTTSLNGCIHGVRAKDGTMSCKFTVGRRVQNRNGHLHGGCIATIVDIVGTAALLTRSTRAGVSLNIATTYLKAIPGNAVVQVDACILRQGRTIATVNVDIVDESTGEVCARGVHTKFISSSEPDLGSLSLSQDEGNGDDAEDEDNGDAKDWQQGKSMQRIQSKL